MVAALAIGGAVAGIGGAYLSSQGAQNAANTQANAAQGNENNVLAAGRQASGMDLGAINQANSYFQPYANIGNASAAGMQNLLTGMNNGQAMNALNNMPGYQFERQQVLEATQNGFAAKGLASSGAAIKGAGNYAQGLASTDLNNYYNQLMGGVGVGANAATNMSQNTANLTTAGANAMMGSATNAASLGMAGATAQASGQIGSANAMAGGLANVSNGLTNYSMMNMLTQQPMQAQSMYSDPQFGMAQMMSGG